MSTLARVHLLPERASMSYRAIATALTLENLSVGQRLAAFALASFANREHRAWPSTATAAARAGLSRRQYLAARGELAQRGLVVLERPEARQFASALIRLTFAEDGRSIDREVNPGRFEAALTHSRSGGGARVLLAVLAALSDSGGVVDALSVDEICDAGGLSDSAYRRARTQLLGFPEIVLAEAGGGRSRCNRWRVAISTEHSSFEDRSHGAEVAAPSGLSLEAVAAGENPVVNPGQNRTPSGSETPSETPSQTPSSRARPGKESQNQRTTPPDPPEGGHGERVSILEEFVNDRGRRRQRLVQADPATELSPTTAADHAAWKACRQLLREALGDSMFEIWLAPFELIAVSRIDGALLIAGGAESQTWVERRYGRVLASVSGRCGRLVRVASDRELALHRAVLASEAGGLIDAPSPSSTHDHQEAV
jgi:hypothetical protein